MDSEFRPYLEYNERILWTGKPKQGIIFRPMDIFLIPFTFLWCGFAIVWMTLAVTGGAPFMFILFGVPFVIIGLLISVGRFIIDARNRARTTYGITEKRILILSGNKVKDCGFYTLNTLPKLKTYLHRDGTGTILLSPSPSFTLSFLPDIGWWPSYKSQIGLYFIDQPHRVESLIQELQGNPGSRRA